MRSDLRSSHKVLGGWKLKLKLCYYIPSCKNFGFTAKGEMIDVSAIDCVPNGFMLIRITRPVQRSWENEPAGRRGDMFLALLIYS